MRAVACFDRQFVLQLSLSDPQVPEVLLGPRICAHLAQAVNLFDQRCDLASLALRFSAVSHHAATAAARVIPALQTGDHNKIWAALKQLQIDAPKEYALLKMEAKESGFAPKLEGKSGKRKYALCCLRTIFRACSFLQRNGIVGQLPRNGVRDRTLYVS